jgi:hypothetical protein
MDALVRDVQAAIREADALLANLLQSRGVCRCRVPA